MYEGKDIQRGLVTNSKKRDAKFSMKMNKLGSVRKQLFPSSQKDNYNVCVDDEENSAAICLDEKDDNSIIKDTHGFGNIHNQLNLLTQRIDDQDVPVENVVKMTRIVQKGPNNSTRDISESTEVITASERDQNKVMISNNINDVSEEASDNALVTTGLKYILYIPEWYEERINSGDNPLAVHADLNKRDWITDDLDEEIRNNFPGLDDIMVNSSVGESKADLEAFKKKCAIIFAVDRVFLSKRQLVQTAERFLKGWNCSMTTHGSSIVCFYSDEQKKEV